MLLDILKKHLEAEIDEPVVLVVEEEDIEIVEHLRSMRHRLLCVPTEKLWHYADICVTHLFFHVPKDIKTTPRFKHIRSANLFIL